MTTTASPALLANVLRLAAAAVDLTDAGVCTAVSAAMDHAGTNDPLLFADAVMAAGRAGGKDRAAAMRAAADNIDTDNPGAVLALATTEQEPNQ